MLTAIDIHPAYQPEFPIESASVDCVVTKVTEGMSTVIGAASYVDRTLACGKLAGVYHFLNRADDIAEANHFVDQVQGWIGRAVLCVDWEQYGVSTADGLWDFCRTVHDRAGVWPLVYTNRNDEKAIRPGTAKTELQSHCGLWLSAPGAAWDKTDWPVTGFPDPPSGWLLAMWQAGWLTQSAAHTHFGWSRNRVDIDWFFGDRNAWSAYAQGDHASSTGPIAPEPATAGTTYTVQPGDTLSRIAADHGTTYQRLAALNHIPNPDLVYPGQRLMIG
ncbi:MAG: LysM peptidoglycan-binding domain-containing protein [Propionibacteriaceae bacterium]|nr:LysM peptidoglycan-binding domain-containing protein [Propionibacteriaceae bacterium]